MPMLRHLFILILVLIPLFFSCGGKRVYNYESAEAMYEEALRELNKKGGFPWILTGTNYDKVFKLLKDIQLRYTYSSYAVLAELRTADAYFKKGEYEQAAIEYERFVKNHPGHSEIPYAIYRLAVSYYKQRRSYDRDPTYTREALRWFEVFVERYPDSPLVTEARERIKRCRSELAKREIYIGKFYEKRGNHRAAINRFRVVVDRYGDTKSLEEALFLLGKAYYEENQFDLAKEALDRVVREFPHTKYHDKAAKLLAEIEKKEGRGYREKDDKEALVEW